jgi:hypothetical protein
MELFKILTFKYAKTENVDVTTIISDSDPANQWTDLLSLTETIEAGTYAVVGAIQFQVGTVRQSFIYRFSYDGGATWGPEYYKEVKDKQNVEVVEVLDVIEHAGGDIDFKCQVTREGDFDCTVLKAILSVERKG